MAAEDAKGKKASTTDRAAVLEDEARRTEVLRMLRGEEGGSSVLGGGDKTRQALQQFFPGLYGTMQPLEEGKHGPALRDVCHVCVWVLQGR